MRKSLRFFVAPLLLCALLLPLVSCGGEKTPSTVTTGQTGSSPAATTSAWEGLDFGGATVRFSINTLCSQSTLTGNNYITGPDTYGSSNVMNLIYDRNRQVCSTLNLQTDYRMLENMNSSAKLITYLQTNTMASSDIIDMYLDGLYGLFRCQLHGFFINALEESEENHLDFSADGWYNAYMRTCSFNPNERIYELVGDYFLDQLRKIHAMGVNIEMFDDAFSTEGGSDLLYNTVSEGKWTYDVFRDFVERAYRDNGLIPDKVDRTDTLGLVTFLAESSDCFTGITLSSSMLALETDENGNLYYPDTNPTMITLIDEVMETLLTTGSLFTGIQSDDDAFARFSQDDALFLYSMNLYRLEGGSGNSDFSMGIIPFPKLQESDNYVTSIGSSASTGAIGINTPNFEEITAFLQAVNTSSKGIVRQYYEEDLKFKYNEDPRNTAMLDILYSGISHIGCNGILLDGLIIQETGGAKTSGFVATMESSIRANENRFASTYAGIVDSRRVGLADLLDRFNRLP